MAAATQEDNNPWGSNPPPEIKSKQGLFEKKTLSRKVSEKYEKTKTAASSGMKKMKEGVKESASASAYWMKLKYHSIRTNQKN